MIQRYKKMHTLQKTADISQRLISIRGFAEGKLLKKLATFGHLFATQAPRCVLMIQFGYSLCWQG
jgi:hypothetical protein